MSLIADQNVQEMSTVFESSIARANLDLTVPLVGVIDEVAFGNAYEASQKLCNMMTTGLGGVFGTTSKSSALHMMNVCDSKEVPYIYSHKEFDPNRAVINLHPLPNDIARCLYDLIKVFEWKIFTFLYESGEYLPILNGLVELYAEEDGPFISVRRYGLEPDGDYRNVLRRIRKSQDNLIVIVGSKETLPEVLAQAQQTGMITEDYKYIIGNLDLQTIDLEEFKYSEANITGIRMFSPDQPEVKLLITALGYPEDDIDRNVSCPITLEMALLYDAVRLFAEGTKSIELKSAPLNCDDKEVLDNGYTFSNYLALSEIEGLTGKILFNGRRRTNYTFEIIELTAAGLATIGHWSTHQSLRFSRYAASNVVIDTGELTLVNKTFAVLLALNAPYAMLKQSTDKLNGNDRYEGFGVDLIKELAEKLGFNFTFKIHVHDNYGFYDTKTNISTGMVHEIMVGNADLGVTDLTITSEREAGVDFTIPFMNLGISILYKKPRKDPPKLFSFMDPFSGEVWVYLGIAYFGVSLSLFILGRISPYEWENPYPCIEEPTELENQLSLGNSLWFTTGSLLQQGSEIAPKALSTRLVACVLWLFTLIVVSSYTANLAACLTIETPISLIDDVQDLAMEKGGVKYGAKRKGSTRNFFEYSEEDPYKKMNKFMTKNSKYLTSTNDEGVQKVLTENYAFLMESTTIEYNVARNCNLTQVGKLLDEKSYGVAMRKNWPYRDKLNNALLQLQESGVLSKMKSKWWNEVGTAGCTKKKEANEAAKLGMPNVGGIYFVLLVGSLVAAACSILDWLFFVFRKARHHGVPFKDALKEEFGVVVEFSNDTKIVQSTGSIYSRHSSFAIEARGLQRKLERTDEIEFEN
ncbi:glutamate receptor ionotropic, kainate 2-like isoform X2 [Episyrphus balteatus]|uniref:glutamate receptor ionotropic, kainate 2-like isoform X2 n=1 Tax=Episyrphus balteatus TaxID=286459 RepID=UPI002484F030|nr:glutamate receptor ionotropic, kainate 2-like isoform X2 [Episyrphus balteatus]